MKIFRVKEIIEMNLIFIVIFFFKEFDELEAVDKKLSGRVESSR